MCGFLLEKEGFFCSTIEQWEGWEGGTMIFGVVPATRKRSQFTGGSGAKFMSDTHCQLTRQMALEVVHCTTGHVKHPRGSDRRGL